MHHLPRHRHNAALTMTGQDAAPHTASPSDQHDSLKYHLLGPSLTKAGQDSVDQQKVSEIIYNASKGSKFFNNEQAKDKTLTDKIAKILAKKSQIENRLRCLLRRCRGARPPRAERGSYGCRERRAHHL
jgi:hypothetical protein